jgi:heme a synthase
MTTTIQVAHRRELDHTRLIRLWLYVVAALVFAMVLVGGATRLTESGLSITEWQPVMGIVPPLNDAQWHAEFEKYQAIPQYRQLNAGMSLAWPRTSFLPVWSTRPFSGRHLGGQTRGLR